VNKCVLNSFIYFRSGSKGTFNVCHITFHDVDVDVSHRLLLGFVQC